MAPGGAPAIIDPLSGAAPRAPATASLFLLLAALGVDRDGLDAEAGARPDGLDPRLDHGVLPLAQHLRILRAQCV